MKPSNYGASPIILCLLFLGLGLSTLSAQIVRANKSEYFGWGHTLTTSASIDTTGDISATTRTEARWPFCGWTGGAMILLSDANSHLIGSTRMHSFGIDAWPFGAGDRTDYWSEDFGSVKGRNTKALTIVQGWTPKPWLSQLLKWAEGLSLAVATILPIVKALLAML